MDLFADALCAFFETGDATIEVERDDGFKNPEDLSWYLSSYRSFPIIEKQALRFARGRVLDIGCGAGRHALYLQRRGLAVTGVDLSTDLVELARRRGLKDARQADVCVRLPFENGTYDTILLLGNNLGLCGSLPKFRRLLQELHRITARGGRILATTMMPQTTDAAWRAYLARNVAKGRPIGQMRLRLIFNGTHGRWFDLLLFSPTDLLQIALKEGWRMTHVFPWGTFEKGYSVVFEKA